MPKPRKGTVTRKRSTSGNQSRTEAADTAGRPIDAQAIATRAYELFLGRGATHGDDWADWLTAERELAEAGDEKR